MNSKVQIYTDFDGRREMLISDDGLPASFFVWSFLLDKYGTLQFNTRKTYTATMYFVLNYFKNSNIDIVERVNSGAFFNLEELRKFILHCKYKVAEESRSENVDSISLMADRKFDKALDILIHSTRHSDNKVSGQTVKGRLARFISFVEYLYKIFYFDNSISPKIHNKMTDLKRIIEDEKRKAKSDNASVKDPFESPIPDEIFFKLLEIIHPTSAENPFKGSRFRNSIIINTFIETGVRIGAVAKIKISDVKGNSDTPRILVTRTPDDKSDPRRIRPSQKTKAHSTAISVGLMKRLESYIVTKRKDFNASESHDFLFVSEKGVSEGQPLSLNAFASIIKKLSNTLNFNFSPHTFRFKWNEIFDSRAIEAGYTPQQLEDIRKYAMGWTENSKMGLLYNEFRNAVKVHELSAERSSGFMPEAEEDVK